MEPLKEVETIVKRRRNIIRAKKMPSETGYKGVRLREQNTPENRYVAYITLYNKYKNKATHFTIGNFSTPEEAHNERIKYIAKLF